MELKLVSKIAALLGMVLVLTPLSISIPVSIQEESLDNSTIKSKDPASTFVIQIIDDMNQWEDSADEFVDALPAPITAAGKWEHDDGKTIHNDIDTTEQEESWGDEEEAGDDWENGEETTTQQLEGFFENEDENLELITDEEEQAEIDLLLGETPVAATKYKDVEYIPFDDNDFETEDISAEGEVKAENELRKELIFLDPGCDISGTSRLNPNSALLILGLFCISWTFL